MNRLPSLLCACLATLPSALSAGEFTIEPGASFTYADPPGLCRIEAAHSEAEANLLAMFAAADGENLKALVTLYDCPFVESLATATPGDAALWVRVVTATQDGSFVVLPIERAEFVHQIGAQLEEVMGGPAGPELDSVLEQAIERVNREIATTAPSGGFQLSKVEPLGVLAKEEQAVYAGIVGLVSLGEKQAHVLTVLGVTQLRGRPITVYLSRPYAGPEMVQDQLAETRAMVADLVQRNDPEGAAGDAGGIFDWGRIALYTAIGAVAGLIAALLLKARRKRRRT